MMNLGPQADLIQIFAKYLKSESTDSFFRLVRLRFNELPVLALGENLVACHAGPVPGAVSYEAVLNADVGDDTYQALIDSRHYSARDVALFIKTLNHHPYPYTAKTLFVVGHHRLPNELSIQGGFKGIDYHFALQPCWVCC